MKKKNLKKVLSALVDEGGYETVRRELGGLRPPVKPQNAVAVVGTLDLGDDQKKQALMVLAEKYDAKKFMPRVENIRAFWDDMGRDASRINKRPKIPVAVFQCLATWDTVRLQGLASNGRYTPKTSEDTAIAIDKAKRRTYS
ncbi:MAG: hypothetical protein ACR2P4_10555 [Gammaproteobacteria bacterium]